MRVLLRNTSNGCYLQEDGHWVTNPEKGFDFGSIPEAMELAGQIGRDNLELALAFGSRPSLISAVSLKAAQAQVAHHRAPH
jgi:hypothetical protein